MSILLVIIIHPYVQCITKFNLFSFIQLITFGNGIFTCTVSNFVKNVCIRIEFWDL